MTTIETDTQLINDVISDNQLIFNRISTELLKASSEIKIAMAWFTDNELLNILVSRASNNVRVEIILADVSDNEKLDFTELQNCGGKIYIIKGSGYAKMHHKFCVIDEKLAISGSYNWTMNARRNNHENITVSNHINTVQAYIKIFDDIKNELVQDNTTHKEHDQKTSDIEITKPQLTTTDLSTDYQSVINKLIDTEVSAFDKQIVSTLGYNRARASNGDHNIIPKALDSLYNTFLNDVEVIKEKKERLIDKINEQEKLYNANLQSNLQLKLGHLEKEFEIDSENFKDDLKTTESLIEKNQLDQKKIEENDIPRLNNQIENLITEKHTREQEKIPIIKNKGQIIFYSCLSLILAIYIFIFYSSAIYLMISGLDKANSFLQIGEQDKLYQFSVFYPSALSNAFNDHGVLNVVFLSLGSLILLSIPICFNISTWPKNKLGRTIAFLVITIAVDFLIAFKITNILQLIKNLTDRDAISKTVPFKEIFEDSNFWIVLLLGSLAIFIFHIIYDKVVNLIKERRPTEIEYKKSLQIKEINSKIESKITEQEVLIEQLNSLQKSKLELSAKMESLSRKLQSVPKIYNGNKFGIEELNKTMIRKISDLTHIYINSVQNERIPPSDTSLADRFNCFFEGWVNLLHEEFSVIKAESKTQEARDIINNWQRIDNLKAIKLN